MDLLNTWEKIKAFEKDVSHINFMCLTACREFNNLKINSNSIDYSKLDPSKIVIIANYYTVEESKFPLLCTLLETAPLSPLLIKSIFIISIWKGIDATFSKILEYLPTYIDPAYSRDRRDFYFYLRASAVIGNLRAVEKLFAFSPEASIDELLCLSIYGLKYPQAMDFYLERGADISAFNNLPMEISLRKGHYEIVSRLLELGIDVNIFGSLIISEIIKYSNEEKVINCLHLGADISNLQSHILIIALSKFSSETLEEMEGLGANFAKLNSKIEMDKTKEERVKMIMNLGIDLGLAHEIAHTQITNK